MSSQQKSVKLPPGPALPNGRATEGMDNEMIKLITISDDEAHSPRRLHGKNNVLTCDNVQTLVLVEDMDILFPEDRGCIAAIKHIAETAKGPIILTSNSELTCYNSAFFLKHIAFYQLIIFMKISLL